MLAAILLVALTGCNGGGKAACVGTVPSGSALDTSKPGERRFFVKAQDEAGNKRTATVDYRVR